MTENIAKHKGQTMILIPYKEYMTDKFHIRFLQDEIIKYVERKAFPKLLGELHIKAQKAAKKDYKTNASELKKRAAVVDKKVQELGNAIDKMKEGNNVNS